MSDINAAVEVRTSRKEYLGLLTECQTAVDLKILSGRLSAEHRGWLPVFMAELSLRPTRPKKDFKDNFKKYAEEFASLL